MSNDRDVAAFTRRAGSYDAGPLGEFHREIARRVAALTARYSSRPRRVLDLGCGTGYALSLLKQNYPGADILVGVDPAEGMIEVARGRARDARVRLARAEAERLPFMDSTFDLIVATTTFDHWSDQTEALSECSRVLAPKGLLILTDLFGLALVPTLAFRRDKARTVRRAERLLTSARFRLEAWERAYPPVIKSVVARRLDV